LADGIGAQLWIQIKSVIFTVVYTGVLTAVILKVLDATMGLRISDEEEQEGIDITSHDERGYIF